MCLLSFSIVHIWMLHEVDEKQLIFIDFNLPAGITSWKLTIETLEQGVKYVQS